MSHGLIVVSSHSAYCGNHTTFCYVSANGWFIARITDSFAALTCTLSARLRSRYVTYI
jgi:hypothetical protein